MRHFQILSVPLFGTANAAQARFAGLAEFEHQGLAKHLDRRGVTHVKAAANQPDAILSRLEHVIRQARTGRATVHNLEILGPRAVTTRRRADRLRLGRFGIFRFKYFRVGAEPVERRVSFAGSSISGAKRGV